MLGVGHVVTTSIGMCDIDIRPVRPDAKAWQRDLTPEASAANECSLKTGDFLGRKVGEHMVMVRQP